MQKKIGVLMFLVPILFFELVFVTRTMPYRIIVDSRIVIERDIAKGIAFEPNESTEWVREILIKEYPDKNITDVRVIYYGNDVFIYFEMNGVNYRAPLTWYSAYKIP